jgi:hypothetical protein
MASKPRDLAATIQALYDSEINVTITMLWDGGMQFAFISYMNFQADDIPWESVDRAEELADAMHSLALLRYPESGYAKLFH